MAKIKFHKLCYWVTGLRMLRSGGESWVYRNVESCMSLVIASWWSQTLGVLYCQAYISVKASIKMCWYNCRRVHFICSFCIVLLFVTQKSLVIKLFQSAGGRAAICLSCHQPGCCCSAAQRHFSMSNQCLSETVQSVSEISSFSSDFVNIQEIFPSSSDLVGKAIPALTFALISTRNLLL